VGSAITHSAQKAQGYVMLGIMSQSGERGKYLLDQDHFIDLKSIMFHFLMQRVLAGIWLEQQNASL
jgi:hypothetical protein